MGNFVFNTKIQILLVQKNLYTFFWNAKTAYMNYFSSFILLLSVFYANNLFSETILLKNGNIITAKVIEQNSKEITIKADDGKVQKFSKNAILKVIYKNIDAKEAQRIKQEEEQKLLDKNKSATDKKLAEDALKKKQEEEDQKKQQATPYSRTQLVLRSMVLPGWGQYKENRTVPAIVYPSILAISIFGAYEKNREYRNAARDFNNLNSPYYVPTPSSAILLNPASAYIYNLSFEAQREAVDRHRKMRNSYLLGALLIYLLNIADTAYFYDSGSVSRGLIFDYTPLARKSQIGDKMAESEITLGIFAKF